MKAVKHQCFNIKAVLNEKSKTEEVGSDESDSNNELIFNDYITLSIHIFFKG